MEICRLSESKFTQKRRLPEFKAVLIEIIKAILYLRLTIRIQQALRSSIILRSKMMVMMMIIMMKLVQFGDC